MSLAILGIMDSYMKPYSVMNQFEFTDLRYPYRVNTLRLSNRLELAYIDEGSGPETLIMLHGLGSYIPAWNRVIDGLRGRFRCIALDLPGYGKSSKGTFPISMRYYVDVVINFMDALGLDRVTLLGHSMGGQISMHMAYRYPHRVQHMVLIAPAGFERYSRYDQLRFDRTAAALTVKLTSAKQIRDNLAINFYQMPPEAEFMVRDRIAWRHASEFPLYCHSVSASVQGMLQQPVLHLLPHIPHPTLVIFGENDRLIPNSFMSVETTRLVAERGTQSLPRGELLMLSRCGHFAMYEQAETVNRAIEDFVIAQSPPAPEPVMISPD